MSDDVTMAPVFLLAQGTSGPRVARQVLGGEGPYRRPHSRARALRSRRPAFSRRRPCLTLWPIIRSSSIRSRCIAWLTRFRRDQENPPGVGLRPDPCDLSWLRNLHRVERAAFFFLLHLDAQRFTGGIRASQDRSDSKARARVDSRIPRIETVTSDLVERSVLGPLQEGHFLRPQSSHLLQYLILFECRRLLHL
jgi:hypothetical protein